MDTEPIYVSTFLPRFLLFAFLAFIVFLISISVTKNFFLSVLAFIIVLLFSGIVVVYEYERLIVFTFGRFSGLKGPGLNLIVPLVQSFVKVDMRIITVDIRKQEVMTKDNVPVKVDAVVYFRVVDPEKAVLGVKNYTYAISRYAQTALRDAIGMVDLDELLERRDEVARGIEKVVDEEVRDWGIDVVAVKMQDIELPQELKRAMARQAEAEREKRATIIKSEGEIIAARNLAKAAEILVKAPGALHLRTLQTISDIAPDPSTKILIPIPWELFKEKKRE